MFGGFQDSGASSSGYLSQDDSYSQNFEEAEGDFEAACVLGILVDVLTEVHMHELSHFLNHVY